MADHPSNHHITSRNVAETLPVYEKDAGSSLSIGEVGEMDQCYRRRSGEGNCRSTGEREIHEKELGFG
jgi:hypothetical protein